MAIACVSQASSAGRRALSPPPERPIRKAASSYVRDPRLQNTKNSKATITTPQLKRKRPHEAIASQTSPKPSRKRRRVSLAERRENFDWDQASASIKSQSNRVRYWIEQGIWLPEAEEGPMKSFRDNYVPDALATKRRSFSLGHKRSSGSLNADTTDTTDTISSNKDFGSFMGDHEEGITPESTSLCQKLLNTPQKPPEDTLFSDKLFPQVCKMVKGQNKATGVRYILPQLVPSPKIQALRGAEHLGILNEIINASWINVKRCCNRRPQPDYSIGIDREAFNPARLQKLQPFIGSQLEEESQFTATYDTCFPFLTTEVKCGATALDVADRQNAVSQTVRLRGLVTLFRLVHREQELHRKVLGFSISHDNEAVRIYGHYPFIDGKKTTYHRCVISTFDIVPTIEGDKRWKTPTFVQNVQDLWVVKHFKMICSAVDMLQLEAESSRRPALSPQFEQSRPNSGRSRLSQQVEGSEIADEPQTGQPTARRQANNVAPNGQDGEIEDWCPASRMEQVQAVLVVLINYASASTSGRAQDATTTLGVRLATTVGLLTAH
ncbi:hypothetical protein B7494_g7771 [Chlorociboria aeruginascens]|nr:hypothetical protein B7494_g7771 [Chlorociboria aeruginascens]